MNWIKIERSRLHYRRWASGAVQTYNDQQNTMESKEFKGAGEDIDIHRSVILHRALESFPVHLRVL